MADPLGGDQFDIEHLAEAEVEKLLKQVIILIESLKKTILYLNFSIELLKMKN